MRPITGTSRIRRSRPATILAALLALSAVFPSAALGQDAEADPYNVDFNAGWGGCYRPLYWMPVELTVYTRFKEPVAADITLTGQQDQLTEVAVRHQGVFTPNLPLYLPLVTKLNFGSDGLDVSIRPQGKAPNWNHHFGLGDYGSSRGSRSLTAVSPGEVLIGVVGGGLGVLTGCLFVTHTNQIHEWIFQTTGIIIWSRSPTSTPSFAWKCGRRSGASMARWGLPRST